MVRAMPAVRNLRPGYTITYPNRDKAASQATKLVVVLIMLASVVLMLAITIGGWSKLQGLNPINFAWCLAYLIIAFYVWRWARGLLPIAAALAMLLLIVSLIAGTGASGASWFDRSGFGYQAPQSLFGGTGLTADTLGLLTVLLAPVQMLLIFFAMRGFAQGWNVEVEAPIDKLRERAGTGRPGGTPAGGTGAPAAAQ
jgi:hypothetical protein